MKLTASVNGFGQVTYRILVVDLEPTHYKSDLWNAFSDSGKIEILVIYTERKNRDADGGHNYFKFPTNRHEKIILEGGGLYEALRSALFVSKKIVGSKTDLVYISGYTRLSTVAALVLSVALRKRFVLHSDEFNNGRPQGKFSLLKWFLRGMLRVLAFKFGEAILVCGRRGMETALLAGCEDGKILDFPYVIDANRLRTDVPGAIPQECVEDLGGGEAVILFSGRMIPRKGLPTLLAALSDKAIIKKCILWIEGDGPELEKYKSIAQELGCLDRCRFLGFCQYDLHSWLIRSADIIVVPSLVDTWGIVVDEALQLGKAVISSDATGSGYDRILNGKNGFIFPAGDVGSLSNIIITLINNKDQRTLIGIAAISEGKNLRPVDNLETILKLIKK